MTNRIDQLITSSLSPVSEHSFAGVSAFMKPLYKAYFEFLNDHFSSKLNIKLKVIKNKGARFGFVSLSNIKTPPPKNHLLTVADVGLPLQLMYIAHEFTHIQQIAKGRLGLCDGGICLDKHLAITLEDYSKFSGASGDLERFKEYKNIPFEREAYDNQKNLPPIFMKSDYYKDLAGINPTLDMMMTYM